jgi:hypothetical protein
VRDHSKAPLGDVFARQPALASGLTRGELAWALKSGRLLTLRRGAYCWRATFEETDDRGRHLLHLQAAMLVHHDRHVASHLSAALSWGLPDPFAGIGRPTLTLPGAPASTDRQPDLVVQVAELRPQDVRPWKSGQRTSVTRTVVDCLRHLVTPDAVAIADKALHEGWTSLGALHETMTWQSGWPYAERGRAALLLADGRRESPLESWSFVKLHFRGIPLPRAQVLVYDAYGRLAGRADGWWPEHATLCEVDGRMKYALGDWPDLAAAEAHELFEARVTAAQRAVVDEKLREDRLRSLGLEVVRWGMADIGRDIRGVDQAIRRAWRRGDPERVTARLVQVPHPGAGGLAVGYT